MKALTLRLRLYVLVVAATFLGRGEAGCQQSCGADTLFHTASIVDGAASAQDTIHCLPTCMPCLAARTFVITPVDGCIEIGGDDGNIAVIVRTDCNKVIMDTCGFVSDAAYITIQACANTSAYWRVTVCHLPGKRVWAGWAPWMGTGQAPLPPATVDTDTLCPTMSSAHHQWAWMTDTTWVGMDGISTKAPRKDVIQVGIPSRRRIFMQGQ